MPRTRELSLLDLAIAGVLSLFALVLIARATALLIITPPVSWAFVAAFGVAVALTAAFRIALGRRSGMPVAGLTVTLLVIMQPEADPFRLLGVWTAASLVTQLLALSVVFSATSDLRGWGPNDLLVLVGIHFFIAGLIGIVMRPSMESLMEGIRLGTFDFLLLKPADSQLLASVQTVAPQSATDVVVGTGVIIFAMTRLGVALGPLEVLLFLAMLLAGLVIVYSFLLLLATCAFWFVKLDNVLVIFQSLFGNAGRWPVTIFPGWLRPVLTFVVPIAFAVTGPC